MRRHNSCQVCRRGFTAKNRGFTAKNRGFTAKNRGFTAKNRGFTLIEVLVALSMLALTIAGLAQIQQAAFRHIAVTQEIQQASHLAQVHLNRLNNEARLGTYNGEYRRGTEIAGYPWRLNLESLPQGVFAPASVTLSDKVVAVSADLSVWVDNGGRELRFHTLLLRVPVAETGSFDQKVIRSNLKLSSQK